MKLGWLVVLITVLNITPVFAMIIKGSYVTNEGDTIHTNFDIDELFDLHVKIVSVDSLRNRKELFPKDIQSFSFRRVQYIDYSKGIDELDHSFDNILFAKGYFYKLKTFSLDGEINVNFPKDSVQNYQSIDVDDGRKLFVSIENTLDGPLKTAAYYTKLNANKPYLLNSFWLLIKDGKVVAKNELETADWLYECVKDYKTLSSLIKQKKIKRFPWDFKLVVDDYNRWVNTNGPDTTSYLKGFIEAQNNYKAIGQFSLTYTTGIAFFFPGLVSAVIISHRPQQKIKIKIASPYLEDADFVKGYQQKAFDKRYRTSARGAFLGGLTCIGLLIILI